MSHYGHNLGRHINVRYTSYLRYNISGESVQSSSASIIFSPCIYHHNNKATLKQTQRSRLSTNNTPAQNDNAADAYSGYSLNHEAPQPDENIIKGVKWSTLRKTLDPMILKAVRQIFKYEYMTTLQETLLSRLPLDGNKLVRSKTGTGKTLAFLVPALQRTLDKFGGVPSNEIGMVQINVLILTPTRELAYQIAREIRRLMVYTKCMKAQCFTGGITKTTEMKEFDRHRTDFLVATPGRLLDYLKSTERVNNHLNHIHTLIIDEADTMIGMGFSRDVEAIQEFLPKNINTYMFSATLSNEVEISAKKYMKGKYEFINTVKSTDLDVHERVKQSYMICTSEDRINNLLNLILWYQHRASNKKIMIFMPTTYSTMFIIRIFKILRKCYIDQAFQQFEIHAQRSQEDRMKVSKAFRSAGAASALFTSDISARGVDYPDVDLIIHLGMASDRNQYIHRIGRTARAGKEGESIMILDPLEREFIKELKDIPIVEWEGRNNYISRKDFDKLFSIALKLTNGELKRQCLESYYNFCKCISQWSLIQDNSHKDKLHVKDEEVRSTLLNWAEDLKLRSLPDFSKFTISNSGHQKYLSEGGDQPFRRKFSEIKPKLTFQKYKTDSLIQKKFTQ